VLVLLLRLLVLVLVLVLVLLLRLLVLVLVLVLLLRLLVLVLVQILWMAVAWLQKTLPMKQPPEVRLVLVLVQILWIVVTDLEGVLLELKEQIEAMHRKRRRKKGAVEGPAGAEEEFGARRNQSSVSREYPSDYLQSCECDPHYTAW